MDVSPLGEVFPLIRSHWCWRRMGGPPKATCHASRKYSHGEDLLLLKMSMCP